MSEPPKSKRRVTITVNRADGSLFQEITSSIESEIVEGSLEGIEDVARLKYPRVGHCIYCGEIEHLGREHVIPYGLNGNAVLLAASCAKCREITSSFEREVLRGSMWTVRVRLGFQSRKKHHKTPLTQRLTFKRNGISHTVDLPIERFPIFLRFVTFAWPRYFTEQQKSGIDITGVATILFGPGPEVVGKELGAEELIFTSARDHPTSFARMIAKIGYGMAFVRGDINRIEGPSPVIPSILGEVDDVGRWVGTLPGPLRKYPGPLHRVEIRDDVERRCLVAEVQLFSNSPTPSYIVVLGPLKSKGP